MKKEVWYEAKPRNFNGKIETRVQAYFAIQEHADEYAKMCPNIEIKRIETDNLQHFDINNQIEDTGKLMASFRYENQALFFLEKVKLERTLGLEGFK
jgi:hypothetical protein